MNLQGKRALITGGSSGIGFAIAEAMLAKGARTVITGRRPDVLSRAAELLRAGGGRVAFVAADVSTEKGRETTLKRSEEHTSELQSRQYLVCRLLLVQNKHALHARF